MYLFHRGRYKTGLETRYIQHFVIPSHTTYLTQFHSDSVRAFAILLYTIFRQFSHHILWGAEFPDPVQHPRGREQRRAGGECEADVIKLRRVEVVGAGYVLDGIEFGVVEMVVVDLVEVHAYVVDVVGGFFRGGVIVGLCGGGIENYSVPNKCIRQ